MAFDRQPQAGHGGDPGRVARHGHADPLGPDMAPRRIDPGDSSVLDAESGYLAVLDDVDAALIHSPRKSPGHRVVTHSAATPLQQAALDGKARVLEVEQRHQLADLLAVEQLGIDAVEAHGVAA